MSDAKKQTKHSTEPNLPAPDTKDILLAAAAEQVRKMRTGLFVALLCVAGLLGLVAWILVKTPSATVSAILAFLQSGSQLTLEIDQPLGGKWPSNGTEEGWFVLSKSGGRLDVIRRPAICQAAANADDVRVLEYARVAQDSGKLTALLSCAPGEGSEQGMTPLHFLFHGNDAGDDPKATEAIIRVLMQSPHALASLDKLNGYNNQSEHITIQDTPLHQACFYWRADAVEYLLSHYRKEFIEASQVVSIRSDKQNPGLLPVAYLSEGAESTPGHHIKENSTRITKAFADASK
jgi:hypothetical protein